MKNIITLFVTTAVLIAMADPVVAHSTKGRVKTLLTKKEVTVDDLAYYIEYWVHKEKYKDRNEPVNNRFYVKKFHNIERNGNQINVRFTVLDHKKKEDFDDTMTFINTPDGTWLHVKGNGEKTGAIYTYIPKFDYYFAKYSLPLIVVLSLLAGICFLFRLKRIKTKQASGISVCNHDQQMKG